MRIGQEQSGITVPSARLRAVLTFTAPDQGSGDEYGYYAEEFSGTRRETEARRAGWFNIDAIPYGRMPADDATWYPPFLGGKLQCGIFHFGEDMTELLEYELEEAAVL